MSVLECERLDQGVLVVTLNRPEVHNAFNIAMRDAFTEMLALLAQDEDIRCWIVRGAGRSFCAGADLKEFGRAPSLVAAREIRRLRDVWGSLARLPLPGIALLHGHVLGAGLEVALLCDLRLAAPGATFGFPEAGLGMIPAGGGTQTLPRASGRSFAAHAILTGRRFGVEEARSWGVVQRVVGEEDLLGEGIDLASRIASLDTRLVRLVRSALHARPQARSG